MNWLSQSLVAVLCLIPAWIGIAFFQRNFQIRPDVFLVWYMLGTALTSAIFVRLSGLAIVPSWQIAGAILLIGLTVGAGANILLFTAVGSAPNPGLPVAISNLASVGVFIVALLLARWLPTYFAAAKLDWWSLLGIVLTIIGAALIALRR